MCLTPLQCAYDVEKSGSGNPVLTSGPHLPAVYPGSLQARIASPEDLFPELCVKTRYFLHTFSGIAFSSRFTANRAISFELQNANGRFWKAKLNLEHTLVLDMPSQPAEHRYVRFLQGDFWRVSKPYPEPVLGGDRATKET